MTAADTIVAIASAAGRGAVGIVRVSGPGVPRIAAEILGQLPSPRVATWSRFRDADGNSLDEGLALYFAAPASFTGEEVLELLLEDLLGDEDLAPGLEGLPGLVVEERVVE